MNDDCVTNFWICKLTYELNFGCKLRQHDNGFMNRWRKGFGRLFIHVGVCCLYALIFSVEVFVENLLYFCIRWCNNASIATVVLLFRVKHAAGSFHYADWQSYPSTVYLSDSRCLLISGSSRSMTNWFALCKSGYSYKRLLSVVSGNTQRHSKFSSYVTALKQQNPSYVLNANCIAYESYESFIHL